jgi:hypothetical protein
LCVVEYFRFSSHYRTGTRSEFKAHRVGQARLGVAAGHQELARI